MKIRKILSGPLLALLAAHVAQAQTPADAAAISRFTVGDIRVQGLARVSEGTVFNYLPVNIGDELTPQQAARGHARPVRRPASSAPWNCAATATRWWWWCASGPRSRASRSRATRTSRPRT